MTLLSSHMALFQDLARHSIRLVDSPPGAIGKAYPFSVHLLPDGNSLTYEHFAGRVWHPQASIPGVSGPPYGNGQDAWTIVPGTLIMMSGSNAVFQRAGQPRSTSSECLCMRMNVGFGCLQAAPRRDLRDVPNPVVTNADGASVADLPTPGSWTFRRTLGRQWLAASQHCQPAISWACPMWFGPDVLRLPPSHRDQHEKNYHYRDDEPEVSHVVTAYLCRSAPASGRISVPLA